jgi:hypothetical protein
VKVKASLCRYNAVRMRVPCCAFAISRHIWLLEP